VKVGAKCPPSPTPFTAQGFVISRSKPPKKWPQGVMIVKIKQFLFPSDLCGLGGGFINREEHKERKEFF